MKLFSDILQSLQACIYTFKNFKSLRIWYLIPFLLFVVLFLFSGIGTYKLADTAGEWLVEFIGNNLPESLDSKWSEKILTGINITNSILFWFFKILIWWWLMRILKYIVLVLLSPFFAFLSETIEKNSSGKEYPFKTKQFIQDVFRGILLAIRNFLYEIMIVITCYILSLIIPFLSPFFMGFAWLCGAYFYGFSMMDYTLERRKFNRKQSIAFVWQNKGLAIGTGIFYNIMMLVPVIGMPIAAVNTVVAATAVTVKRLNEETQKNESML